MVLLLRKARHSPLKYPLPREAGRSFCDFSNVRNVNEGIAGSLQRFSAFFATSAFQRICAHIGNAEFAENAEQILLQFYVIDCMMTLPDEIERSFEIEVAEIDEENRMKYVSSIERNALKRGHDQGLSEGLRLGIEGMLESKFGAAGRKLLPQVNSLTEPAELQKFMRILKKANDLDKVRDYFA
jgi:hypothetical protein